MRLKELKEYSSKRRRSLLDLIYRLEITLSKLKEHDDIGRLGLMELGKINADIKHLHRQIDLYDMILNTTEDNNGA